MVDTGEPLKTLFSYPVFLVPFQGHVVNVMCHRYYHPSTLRLVKRDSRVICAIYELFVIHVIAKRSNAKVSPFLV